MNRRQPLVELVVLFGSLGIIGFAGPAAHIALTRREVVERRRWLTYAQLVDLIGITNLIPAPNSTGMAMLVGRPRAGSAGLVVAGLAFILPAAAIVRLQSAPARPSGRDTCHLSCWWRSADWSVSPFQRRASALNTPLTPR